jgi:hypothetical protein
MRNFKLTLCYDGGSYDGWQRQGNSDDTIQGKLETLLGRLLGQSVEVAGSGRTDAGVHALAQVCSFRADPELDCETLLAEIRRYLPEDIGAIALEEAPPRFHARLSCKEKTYVYRIWNSAEPNVFERKWMVAVPQELDLDAMRRAARCSAWYFSSASGSLMRHICMRAIATTCGQTIPNSWFVRHGHCDLMRPFGSSSKPVFMFQPLRRAISPVAMAVLSSQSALRTCPRFASMRAWLNTSAPPQPISCSFEKSFGFIVMLPLEIWHSLQ